MEVNREMVERNAEVPQEKRIEFRVGIGPFGEVSSTVWPGRSRPRMRGALGCAGCERVTNE